MSGSKGAKKRAPEVNTPAPLGQLSGRWWALSPLLRHSLAFLLFTAATLACLAVPSYSWVFPEGKEPRLLGPDAYYHLRHVKAVLAHYPRVERPDFMVNFPSGEPGLNQGFFDVGVATLVKMSGGVLTPHLALAWVSPLCQLIAAAAGFVWFLSRGHQLCGYLFLLFCVLYSGPVKANAALGNGDHHAFEIMMVMLTALALDAYLHPTTSWKWGPLAVCPLFFFYLSWPGTPLHVLLVGVVFYARAWQPPAEGEKNLSLKGVAYGVTLWVMVEATAYLWPWTIIWSPARYLVGFAAAVLAAGFPVLLWIARKPWKRKALVALGLVLGALLVAYLSPVGHQALERMFEERTRQISEHTPASAPLLFGWYGFLWLVALAAPWRVWQRRAGWEAIVPMVFGGGLIFFWLKTFDFAYYTPLALAAAAAYVLGTVEWKRPIIGLVALLVVLPLLPKMMDHPWGDRWKLRDTVLYSEGLESASRWLKSVQGPPLPPDQREYGLICPWDLGNILSETADTPVSNAETASDRLAKLLFSDKPDEMYAKLEKREKPFRYILLPARNLAEKFIGEMGAADLKLEEMFKKGPQVAWDGKDVTLLAPSARNRRSLISRLYWDLGEQLGHFRLVYESPEQAVHVQRIRGDRLIEFYAWPAREKELSTTLKPLLDAPEVVRETSRGALVGGRQAPEVRIFEIVPGALLEGDTRPGALVLAALSLEAPTTKRRWSSTWSTEADAGGHFSLRVPYSTEAPLNADPDTVRVLGAYKVTVNGLQRWVPISEDAVQKEQSITLR